MEMAVVYMVHVCNIDIHHCHQVKDELWKWDILKNLGIVTIELAKVNLEQFVSCE